MRPASPQLIPRLVRRQLARIRSFGWHEVAMLVAALFILVCIYGVIELADEVKEGATQTVDEWILRSLRRVDDSALPIGPAWMWEVGLDLTALGSPTVLTLTVIASIGLMWLQRKRALVLFTLLTTISGAAMAGFLKYLIARDRPAIVLHLREVTSHSFPSGHAMVSAIVYLTLGTLLMQIVVGRGAKLFCLIGAMLLTFLVGISRIYLGVHYPTDVLAGWMAGIAWALGCWIGVQYFHHPPALRETCHEGNANLQ